MENEQNYKFDLDETLENEIKFGKYQVFALSLISVCIFLRGIYDSMYIFTAGEMNYRCEIPQCEHESTEFHPPWLNISTPFDGKSPEKCRKFQYVSNDTQSCKSESFDDSMTVECDSFVYETEELTIQNQFGLTCKKEYQLSLIGTLNSIGTFIGFMFVGIVSDRLGRKFLINFNITVNIICGFLRYFSVNYYQYATVAFVDSLLASSTYSAALVLGLELATPKLRTTVGIFLNCFYSFGGMYLGLIAMIFKNYKNLLLTIYIPYVLFLSFYFILPESIRWLLSKGKNEIAKKILNKACRYNGTTLSDKTIKALNERIEMDNVGKYAKNREILRNITYKIMLQIVILTFIWFTSLFAYYGLNRNSVYLAFWNKYINFIFVMAIELPSYFVTQICMDKLGRKRTLFIGMLFCGVFLILAEFIPGVLYKTIFFVFGKLFITVAFTCLYIYTIELFPTNIRHGLLLICCLVGRIGSILAPMTPLLTNISPSLPMIIFSIFLFTSAVFLCYLPETQDRKLPESMDETFD